MWKQIESNKRKTFLVITVISIFLVAFSCCCAFLISSDIDDFIIINLVFFVIFGGMYIYGYKKPLSSFGDNIYKYDGECDKTLFNVVSEMKIASGLSTMPEIYILDSPILNAFACGTNEKNAKIVVSKGLLKVLNRDELQGVIAHEIAHIVNKDTCYLLFASIIVNIIVNISNFYIRTSLRSRRSSKASQADVILLIVAVIFMILAPILANMFYFFLSRKREYLADACSAQYTRNPEGLALALKKISGEIQNLTKENINELNSLSSPLAKASYIVPLQLTSDRDGLFSTHPSTKNRIKILLEMANISRADFDAYNSAYKNITKQNNLIKLADNEKKIINLKQTTNVSDAAPAVMGFVAQDDNLNQNVQPEKEINSEIEQEIENHRKVEDLMCNLAHYINIDCPCQTKLRVPPTYIGKTIVCPHCKQEHLIKAN